MYLNEGESIVVSFKWKVANYFIISIVFTILNSTCKRYMEEILGCRNNFCSFGDLHSLTHSLTHAITHSLTHSLTHSCNHSITDSQTNLIELIQYNICKLMLCYIQQWRKHITGTDRISEYNINYLSILYVMFPNSISSTFFLWFDIA